MAPNQRRSNHDRSKWSQKRLPISRESSEAFQECLERLRFVTLELQENMLAMYAKKSSPQPQELGRHVLGNTLSGPKVPHSWPVSSCGTHIAGFSSLAFIGCIVEVSSGRPGWKLHSMSLCVELWGPVNEGGQADCSQIPYTPVGSPISLKSWWHWFKSG